MWNSFLFFNTLKWTDCFKANYSLLFALLNAQSMAMKKFPSNHALLPKIIGLLKWYQLWRLEEANAFTTYFFSSLYGHETNKNLGIAKDFIWLSLNLRAGLLAKD